MAEPLADHVRSAGAFGVRIGATAVARRWTAETIKAAIADERVTRLSEAIPDQVNHETTRTRNRLRELGWRPRRMRRVSPQASHGSCSSCRSPDVRLINCSLG